MKKFLLKTILLLFALIVGGVSSTWADDYELYSGTIAEGDYVIVYNGGALKNTVTSSRFDYQSVTISENIISNPAASIIWHIAASGNYWTLYNSSVSKYAGGTTTKNQGTLLSSVTDYAKWTVTGTSTYDFENKGRAGGSKDTGNKWLRRNNDFGFACYASGTGGALTLYKKKAVVTVDPTITFNNGSVRVGQKLDLSTLFTSNSDGAVTYSITAGDSYATIAGSTLTGKAEGSVTVKAEQAAAGKYNAGEASATITVNAALALSSIAITTAPTKTTYIEGETFDPTGMVVTATYSDETTEDVTASCTFSPSTSTALTTSDTEITVGYTENAVERTTTQTITVNALPTHTVTFSVNGATSTDEVEEGADIDFPDDLDDINSKTFVGWVTTPIVGTTNVEPSLVTSAKMSTSNITYYAVFALETEEESEILKSYGFETAEDADWTNTGPVRDNSYHNSGSYAGSINTNNTYVTFKNKVKVTEFSFAFTRTSGNNNYNVYIETSTNNSNWTAAETYAMSSFNSDGTFMTKTKTFDGKTELYVRFHCHNTTAVRYVDDVTIKYTAHQTTRSAYCTTVADVTGVTLNKNTTTLVVGETETLTATVAPADAGNKNVSWTTSDANVATVANGVVTAVAAGTATITVTTEQGSKTATCTVTVKNAHGLAYAEVAQTAKYGESFTAPTLTNPNSLTVTYTSSNTDVATVNTTTGEVTINTVGEITITATFAGNETYINGSAAYTLTVNKGDAALAFPRDEYSVVYGNAFETPILSNPNSLTVAYESNNTGVATVDAETGSVTVKGYGTATITASTEGSTLYADGETSYTLNVTKSINTISNINDSYTLDVETADAELTFAATATNGTVSYEVYDDGTTLSEEDVDFLLDRADLTISKNKKGVVKIRAYVAESNNYEAVEKIITVYAQDAPSFTEAADQVMEYKGTYTVVVDTDGEVTLTSSTTVATVAGMVVTANAVGEATITVNCAAGATTKAGSKTFDILARAPEGRTTNVAFNETFAECESNGGNSGGFATASNTKITDEDSYTDNDGWSFTNGYPADACAKFGGSSSAGSATSPSITVESGKTYKLSFKAAPWSSEDSNTMTVTVTGGTINSEASATTTSMTIGQWNDFEFDIVTSSTSLQLEFSCTANRFFLDDINLSYPPTATVILNKYGYATYCSVNPMDFSSTEGYTAWRVNSIASDGTITFKKITEAIKGGQGVLLYNKNADGENTSNVTVNFADSSKEFDNGSDENNENDNLLIGTTAPTYLAQTVGDNTNFGLSANTLKKIKNGTTIAANKAYLPVPTGIVKTLSGSSVKSFTLVFEDETTGITETRKATREEVEAIFNLAGQRLNRTQKGINIVNGKKILVK